MSEVRPVAPGRDRTPPSRDFQIPRRHYDGRMKLQRAKLEDTSRAVFLYITILVSAALVAVPGWRAFPASKPVLTLITVGMVVLFVRRESGRRTLNLTIGQIYEQAKLGRKFAPPAVETAATVIWCMAVMLTY